MTDFPALTLEAAAALLFEAERPLILSHQRPDGDTLGAAAALALFYNRLGRPVRFACADPIPRRLAFLFEGVDAPAPTPEEADGATVIALDVASPAQLGTLYGVYGGRVSLVLDHHATGTPFAPHLVRPEAAAAGELLSEVLFHLADAGLCPPPDREIAMRLYAAISSDTGCFRYANATPATYRTAARLLESGLRADRVNRALFECCPPEQLQAEAIAAGRLSLHAGGRISLIALTRADRAGLADEHFERAVDIARSVEGAEIAAVVRELTPGEYRTSLRATDADVAAVAAGFGGGGHRRAAGCTLHAPSIEDAAALLLPALERALAAQNA